MVYNFKKEEKQFYCPSKDPAIIDIPKMNYIAVCGKGNPNEEDSEYKQSIGMLYAVAYTIKMSKKGSYKILDYFDFVVPPLEGFWWQDNIDGIDYGHKEKFNFMSMIRMPNFVNEEVFAWAIKQAEEKKKIDLSKVKFLSIHEGLCVQAMHVGSYDDEPVTIAKIDQFVKDNNLKLDLSEKRRHHEIYLSDPRRSKPENMKTVIRIPVKK